MGTQLAKCYFKLGCFMIYAPSSRGVLMCSSVLLGSINLFHVLNILLWPVFYVHKQYCDQTHRKLSQPSYRWSPYFLGNKRGFMASILGHIAYLATASLCFILPLFTFIVTYPLFFLLCCLFKEYNYCYS